MPKLEGRGAREGPQLVALWHERYNAAHWKSYRDEPVALEVIGANRETPQRN